KRSGRLSTGRSDAPSECLGKSWRRSFLQSKQRPMTRPILYDYWRSSAAYRVRIALNLKQVDYESRPVNLATGEQNSDEYRAINPQGFVPMLEIDGHRLSQS